MNQKFCGQTLKCEEPITKQDMYVVHEAGNLNKLNGLSVGNKLHLSTSLVNIRFLNQKYQTAIQFFQLQYFA